MLNTTDIGIIDNGVDQNLYKGQLLFDVDIYNDDIAISNEMKKKKGLAYHGSLCALIIATFFNNARISSIRILDDAGHGCIRSVEKALEFCLKNNIRLINLSLGTCNFNDKEKLRSVINYFANRGLIIVAASSNNDYCAYPASFANVIGVRYGEDFDVDINEQINKGIDFIAPSDYRIIIEGASLSVGKCNSYAAPYITAMIGKLLKEKKIETINEVRLLLTHNTSEGRFIYSPDWIESAWISPQYRKKKGDLYFKQVKGNLLDCLDEIDTIVVCDITEYMKYKDLKKNIVYLGKEKVERIDYKHHFWSVEQRRKQIFISKKSPKSIKIPIIYCVFDDDDSLISCFSRLKKYFNDDGYNVYAGCNIPDCILYDIEYLPDDNLLKEEVKSFIYWQTYYQQVDLLLVGNVKKEIRSRLFGKPDITIGFRQVKNNVSVRMFVDDRDYAEYCCSNYEMIDQIYYNIKTCFEKGT